MRLDRLATQRAHGEVGYVMVVITSKWIGSAPARDDAAHLPRRASRNQPRAGWGRCGWRLRSSQSFVRVPRCGCAGGGRPGAPARHSSAQPRGQHQASFGEVVMLSPGSASPPSTGRRAWPSRPLRANPPAPPPARGRRRGGAARAGRCRAPAAGATWSPQAITLKIDAAQASAEPSSATMLAAVVVLAMASRQPAAQRLVDQPRHALAQRHAAVGHEGAVELRFSAWMAGISAVSCLRSALLSVLAM